MCEANICKKIEREIKRGGEGRERERERERGTWREIKRDERNFTLIQRERERERER